MKNTLTARNTVGNRLRSAYTAAMAGACGLMVSVNAVFGVEGDDIWSRFSSMMSDIYNKLLGITTIIAVVMVVIALIIRMTGFGNQRATDKATSWIKTTVISWFIINCLGFIIAYIQPLVAGGQYVAQ